MKKNIPLSNSGISMEFLETSVVVYLIEIIA